MDISIIIPNLHSPIIDQTLKSLELQTYSQGSVEVIVVGMDKFGVVGEDNSVRFHRTEQPVAPAVARNIGIQEAQGDILCFIDADCIASRKWLAAIVAPYDDSSVHVVGGSVAFDENRYWSLADNVSMFYNYMVEAPANLRDLLPSLNLSARSWVFDEIGGFDERYPRAAGEDADLSMRMKKAGLNLHFERRAVVFHRPPRHDMVDLLRHSFYQGRYSVKVDSRHAATAGLLWPFRSRTGLTLFAPILAAAATCRIFAKRKDLWSHWHIIPAVYLSKIGWCCGAATHPVWSE